ncbi:phosphate-starvation-inducible PsiE family protein [Lusitaniella coriacea LEGE 07157]|uniref:Phosphate-starvation-inducible PsiE family protein n=1 Tax=Lusitaniella coriacea LEGE 07157 TaxID=945747 RepID=A0A8J7E0I0_9CYAN|nr:phosphate-starvation-inducible PsiE family protein [Lusitaniella coriacea]MBE9118853.1 phosphate-starvation-inducible PsiE family protein [Lusitaniella coriacea LEGE 07157]
MLPFKKFLYKFFRTGKDKNFLLVVEHIEILIAKFLSILMLLVTLFAIFELCVFLFKSLFFHSFITFFETPQSKLFEAFGLFLNVLIALEILENITVYLRDHDVPYELVLATSLIAVSRKIIIFDLEKKDAMDLIALGVAVLSLSVSYFILSIKNKHK